MRSIGDERDKPVIWELVPNLLHEPAQGVARVGHRLRKRESEHVFEYGCHKEKDAQAQEEDVRQAAVVVCLSSLCTPRACTGIWAA